MTKIKARILTMQNETQPSIVNLQVPLTGIHAEHFNTIKEDVKVKQNTELARMILLPTLELIAEIGLPRFMALVGDNGKAKTTANRSRA